MSKIVKNYDCGLRLVVEQMPNYKSVATSVMIGVGSGDEEITEEGLSHFCEHMLFKGTSRRTGEELINELSMLGVDYNAWTSDSATCYHIKGIKSNTEQCVDILSDMFFNLKFKDEEFYKEGDVIVQEIAMYNDNPRAVLFELANSTFFKGTKYAHSVAGKAEQIKAYKPQDIYNFIKKHYIAPKTIISFAGDITLKEAEKLVDKYFLANFPKTKEQAILPCDNGNIQSLALRVKKKKDTEQENVLLMFSVCNQFSEDRYALGLMSSIFAGDMSSRLFLNVRERAGLVYAIRGGLEFSDLGGYFYVYFSCTPSNTNKVIETVKREIDILIKDGVTEEELKKVKNIRKVNRLFENENTESVNNRNSGELRDYGKIKTTEMYLEKINSINESQIKDIAKKYLDIERMMTAIVGK